MPNTGTVRLKVPEILKDRGMSVTEFAAATGLAYNTASALARGFYDRIGLETIAMICKGLGVTPADLFDYTPHTEDDRS
jgi:DNA-binding Xre family transcriptional regulator